MTAQQAEALQFILRVLQGFEESSLYEDYKEVMGFTDERYQEAVGILANITFQKVD